MLTQSALLLLCLLTILLATLTVPGEEDLNLANFPSLIAYNQIGLGSWILTTNVLLSVISTVQGICVTACVTLFLSHLVRIMLSKKDADKPAAGSVTFATLDVVLMGNYMQLARQIYAGPNAATIFLGCVASLSYPTSAGRFPYATNIAFPNTSIVGSTLISSTSTSTAVSDKSFVYFSDAVLNVAKDCSLGICGGLFNGLTSLLTCSDHHATNCTHTVTIQSDYDMSCTPSFLQPNWTTLPLNSDIIPFDPTDSTATPSIQWSMFLQLKNTPIQVTCTIYAAQSLRTENSLTGTTNKLTLHVYNQPPSKITTDPSLHPQSKCQNLPSPLCMLFLVGNVMNAPWSGTSQTAVQNNTAGWGLNTLTIPIRESSSTDARTVASNLETYMRFCIESVVNE
ncbi:hypothetical protein HDU98_006875 [Podochytrium sp. JEL0797]|nr:hypothetical protein HDU98_006875 [Podochytrium sp. JEL0797]